MANPDHVRPPAEAALWSGAGPGSKCSPGASEALSAPCRAGPRCSPGASEVGGAAADGDRDRGGTVTGDTVTEVGGTLERLERPQSVRLPGDPLGTETLVNGAYYEIS